MLIIVMGNGWFNRGKVCQKYHNPILTLLDGTQAMEMLS